MIHKLCCVSDTKSSTAMKTYNTLLVVTLYGLCNMYIWTNDKRLFGSAFRTLKMPCVRWERRRFSRDSGDEAWNADEWISCNFLSTWQKAHVYYASDKITVFALIFCDGSFESNAIISMTLVFWPMERVWVYWISSGIFIVLIIRSAIFFLLHSAHISFQLESLR